MTTTNTFQGYDGNIKKPTSRVTQPPGGISQVFSGYNEEPEESQNRRTNKSSAPVNSAPQQAERAMAVKQDVNSRSRVFGDDYDPSTDKKRLPQKGTQAATAQLYKDVRQKPKKHVSTYNPITGEAYPGFENHREPELKRKFHNQRGAYNPITGESYDDEDEEEKEEEEKAKQDGSGETFQQQQQQKQQQGNFPTRVKQPPGGKSTALW